MADTCCEKHDYKELENIIIERGYTVRDFIRHECSKNPEILQMNEAHHKEFCNLYDDVFSPSQTTKSKGQKLEDLVAVMFDKAFPNIFEVKRNCRTSSNEIDLLINWKSAAVRIGVADYFNDLGNTFLCECKNYRGKVDVTYVGKFFSLMCYTNTKFGVLVAWEGVTGNGWSDGAGLIKKLTLVDKRYIIVITQYDLYDIYQKNITIFELLKNKYQSLKNDISYELHISKHEAQDTWKL